MKMILMGVGKIGFAIAQQLSSEGHDLTLVDQNLEALRRADAALDVLCMEGNGASVSMLLRAGVQTADLVIAVSGSDESNLICCLLAKKLGVPRTVARVRDPEFFKDTPLLKQEIGLDMVINPEYSAALEIKRILRFPPASCVETFAGGRMDMIGIRVEKSDALAGHSLLELKIRFPNGILVCAAQRGEETVIPNGDFVPELGDELYLIGEHKELKRVFTSLGRTMTPVRQVTILGGSRLAVYLGWELARMDMKLRLVELNPAKCGEISDSLPNAVILQGDGTDEELLESEGLFRTDAFVTLTNRDEENLLMAMNARHRGVPRVLAKMTRPNYIRMVADLDLGTIVSPKDIAANQITAYVRAVANSEGSAVESYYKLLGGKVEVVEFTATPTTNFLLTPLRDLRLKRGLLIAGIVRQGRCLIPDGQSCIYAGDRVIVVAKSLCIGDLNDILR